MKPARDRWVNPALALALCAAAGAACAWLRLPLPWMIGPLVAMAACNFGGAELRAPRGARAAGQIVIGTALGLYFTPLVGREVAERWPVLLVAALSAVLLGMLSGWVLSRISGIVGRTAFFASMPGGAAEMALLGERFHARVDRIALAQSLRVLVVVIVVPLALTYSGAQGDQAYAPPAVPLDVYGFACLLAVAWVAAWVLQRLGMPNAFFFGPLAAAMALTLSAFHLSSLPAPISNAAQMLLGCALGARFERRSLENAPRYVAAVLASVGVAIALAAAAAWAVAYFAGLSVPSMVLAMAPGGIAEMCITAKVLELGVPLVTASHVVRVAVLIVTTGAVFRAARAWRTRPPNS